MINKELSAPHLRAQNLDLQQPIPLPAYTFLVVSQTLPRGGPFFLRTDEAERSGGQKMSRRNTTISEFESPAKTDLLGNPSGDVHTRSPKSRIHTGHSKVKGGMRAFASRGLAGKDLGGGAPF